MRWFVATCSALVVLASYTAESPQVEQGQQATEQKQRIELPPIGARVLIREARGLLTAPERDATRVFASRDEALRVAEVVGHVGDFIELRSINGPSDACSAGGIDPSVSLRFFALPEDLTPVLDKTKRLSFDDGTSLEFFPGVPIVGAGSEPSLRVGSAEFLSIPLADDDLAAWFRVTPSKRSPVRISWPSGRPLHYGEHSITGTTNPPFQWAQAKQVVVDGTLLTFENACGRFTLRVDAAAEESGLDAMKGPKNAIPQIANNFDPDMTRRYRSHGDELWGDLEGCDDSPAWNAAPKTPLLWRETGTPAGEVRQAFYLPRDAIEQDDKQCFVASGLDPCVETAQLQKRTSICDLLRPEPNSEVQKAIKPADEGVGECFAKTAARWNFPKPRDGATVSVVYPFELEPGR